jgi:hypothetical protein
MDGAISERSRLSRLSAPGQWCPASGPADYAARAGVSLALHPARPAPGWGERHGQQRHQGERRGEGEGAWNHHGGHRQDPAEDPQAECLASSPGQEAGGVPDGSQAHRGADRRTAIPIALTAVTSMPAASRSRCWPGSLKPENPRPTSTPERPDNHPGQEGVDKQEHRSLLTLGGGNLTVSVGARWLGCAATGLPAIRQKRCLVTHTQHHVTSAPKVVERETP